MAEESHLLDFYGAECPPCIQLEMYINRLREEEGVVITRYEVWHNSQNQNLMMKYSRGRCNGVPFMYNKKNDSFLCGEVTYERLKEWALKE
ncbi:MAG: hypothetical protein ACMUIE_00810 [Thermoplasmatota archaeon]